MGFQPSDLRTCLGFESYLDSVDSSSTNLQFEVSHFGCDKPSQTALHSFLEESRTKERW